MASSLEHLILVSPCFGMQHRLKTVSLLPKLCLLTTHIRLFTAAGLPLTLWTLERQISQRLGGSNAGRYHQSVWCSSILRCSSSCGISRHPAEFCSPSLFRRKGLTFIHLDHIEHTIPSLGAIQSSAARTVSYSAIASLFLQTRSFGWTGTVAGRFILHQPQLPVFHV